MSIFDKVAQLLLFGKSSQTQDFFFGLNIGEKTVEASVWGFQGKKLTILSFSTQPHKTEDSLLEAGNIALDEALGDLPIDPEKILFGVPDSWLQDDDIKPEHLNKLRRMVKEWGLSPMAYVSTSQAITHFLQKQQGVPLTGILVSVADPLQVAVVKAGKMMASKEHKRTDNLPKDIEKVLMGFNEIEVLPSRILIFGDENFAKVKDELQSFPWMAQLPFLHLPKIEELPVNIQMAAVCLAGASELNPSLNIHPADLTRLAGALPKPESHLSHQIPEEKAVLSHRGARLADDNLDSEFVAGDIAEMEHGKKMVDEDDLGEWEEDENRGGRVRVDHGGGEVEGGIGMALTEMASNLTAPFKGGHDVGSHQGQVGAHHGRGGGGNFFANKIVIFVVVVLMLLIGAYLLLPKAQVTVFIDLRVLEKDAEVIADPNVTAVDEVAKKIPGKLVEANVTGSQKGSATGKKKVGESAKGSVLLYNKTSSSKSFASGTVLTGPNNLSFTLDNTVNVASQSAVDGGISFGKSSGNIDRLRAFLADEGLYVFTINGFPYGNFHGAPVKEGVYSPDWREGERLAYTDCLAETLAALLPEDGAVEGSVSTVPGAFRPSVRGAHDIAAMADLMIQHAAGLVRLRDRTGKTIALGLEPEPFCHLETASDAAAFFREHIFTRVDRFGALSGLRGDVAEEALRRHLGVCLDACHMAVAFEDVDASLAALSSSGVRVVKVQLSAGLEVRPSDAPLTETLDALGRFAEDVYLHQVTVRPDGDGAARLIRYVDLPQAIDVARATGTLGGTWRVHFHVPLFRGELGPFHGTQSCLRAIVERALTRPFTEHLEVETYTWDVLPPELRTGRVADAVARELRWVLDVAQETTTGA